MSGQEQYWVVAADGKEYGPADLETLKQWTREGRVVHATHIRKSGGGTVYAGKMPELVEAFPPRESPGAAPPGQTPPPASPLATTILSEFHVWEFIGRGWDIVKPHWLALSAMFFIQTAIGCVPYIGPCAQFIIGGAIMVGIWRAVLGTIDGRKPDVGMMFQGFDRFGDAFLANLIISVVLIALTIASLIVPMIILRFGDASLSNHFLMILIAIGIVCLTVPWIILLSIMWMFTLPVIGETPLGFWEAIRESSHLTEGYRWRLFLLALACGLVALLGLLVFCVGVFVACAVDIAALGLAYRFLQIKKRQAAQAPA